MAYSKVKFSDLQENKLYYVSLQDNGEYIELGKLTGIDYLNDKPRRVMENGDVTKVIRLKFNDSDTPSIIYNPDSDDEHITIFKIDRIYNGEYFLYKKDEVMRGGARRKSRRSRRRISRRRR